MKIPRILLCILAVSLAASASDTKLLTARVILPKGHILAAVTLPPPSVALNCGAPTSGPVPNGYNFYRSTSSNMSGAALLNTTLQANCSYTDNSALAWGTTYYYAATSVVTTNCPTGFVCESGYSNIAQAVIQSNPIPNPPTLNTPVVTATNVQLNWNEQGAYTAFRVFRKPSARTWWNQLATSIKTLTYTDSSGTAGTSYDYEVRAVNQFGGTVYLSYLSSAYTVTFP